MLGVFISDVGRNYNIIFEDIMDFEFFFFLEMFGRVVFFLFFLNKYEFLLVFVSFLFYFVLILYNRVGY